MTGVLVRMLERFGPFPEPERRSVGGLAEFCDGVPTVRDWPGLHRAAGFDPGRLHRPGLPRRRRPGA